jgi:hypothetical protein
MSNLRKIVAFLDVPLGVHGVIVRMECGHERHFFETSVRNSTEALCVKCPDPPQAFVRITYGSRMLMSIPARSHGEMAVSLLMTEQKHNRAGKAYTRRMTMSIKLADLRKMLEHAEAVERETRSAAT